MKTLKNEWTKPGFLARSAANFAKIALAIFGMVLAEGIIVWGGVIPGAIFQAGIFLLFVNLYIFTKDPKEDRTFLVLALIPLMRILSLALPVRFVPEAAWIALTGAPVLFAVFALKRATKIPLTKLRIHWRQIPGELMMALTGIPIGLSGYLILKPKPILSADQVNYVPWVVVSVFIFGGFLEELLFRGILPEALEPFLGRASGLFCSILFTSMFFGSQSLFYILLAGLIGVMYSVWVQNSWTIWGVVLSHSLWYISLLLIWPVIFRL